MTLVRTNEKIQTIKKKLGIIDLIRIETHSITPKYLQIVNAVKREIESGNIQKGDPMPSINELSVELLIARDTVERGYRQLKKIGIIDAIPRRGYFIKNVEFLKTPKVLLFFNKLNAHKRAIYDSFVETLGEKALTDFYIYSSDFLLLKKLLSTEKGDYTHYVIIPHDAEGGENAHKISAAIPKKKLMVLDKLVRGVKGNYAGAYENYESDIYNMLLYLIKKPISD